LRWQALMGEVLMGEVPLYLGISPEAGRCPCQGTARREYRGTSLIRKRPPLARTLP